jgi:AAHS family 4-hydroxybenzoate transporter-like MFS transporter
MQDANLRGGPDRLDAVTHEFSMSHLGVLVLCAFGLLFDGFDVQAIGFVAPALIKDWGMTKAALGPLFSANLFGMLIGAPLLGSLADKIGRRPILVGALVGCGVLMLLSSRATSLQELMVLRFCTGLGLGALLPTSLAVASEFSPWKNRAIVVMMMSLGFVCGAAIGGAVSAHLIPVYGWGSVFLFAGCGSIVAGAIQFFWLPESRKPMSKTPEGVIPEEGLKPLFRRNYILITLLLWLVNFANLLDLYLLSSWLPTLLAEAKLPFRTAVLATSVFQSGGVPATILISILARRIKFTWLVLANFFIGSISMIGIGVAVGSSVPLLFVAIFLAGFCVVGGQSGVNALGAYYYPSRMRAAGMGWASGIGRFGSAAGPIFAGLIVATHMGTEAVFYGAALAGVLGFVCMIALRKCGRHSEDQV